MLANQDFHWEHLWKEWVEIQKNLIDENQAVLEDTDWMDQSEQKIKKNINIEKKAVTISK